MAQVGTRNAKIWDFKTRQKHRIQGHWKKTSFGSMFKHHHYHHRHHYHHHSHHQVVLLCPACLLLPRLYARNWDQVRVRYYFLCFLFCVCFFSPFLFLFLVPCQGQVIFLFFFFSPTFFCLFFFGTKSERGNISSVFYFLASVFSSHFLCFFFGTKSEPCNIYYYYENVEGVGSFSPFSFFGIKSVTGHWILMFTML